MELDENYLQDKFKTMEGNTQIDDDEKKLSVAKLSMPASVVNFLLDHYAFVDLVELNQISLYILKALGHMEKDGFKFIMYRKVDDKTESYHLDINDLIAKIRIGLSEAMSKKTIYDPDMKAGERNEDENNKV